MGWGSGSILLDNIWSIIHKVIPEDHKKDVAIKLITCFQKCDCDTIDETEIYTYLLKQGIDIYSD
jgi:hypothetical protein